VQPPREPCQLFDEGWTKILTRQQVYCVIAAQRIDPEYSRGGNESLLRRKRSERAAWIRSCGVPFECQ